MYTPPSTRFLPALNFSHIVATRVELLLTTGGVVTLGHTGGTVTVDRGQQVRRTCSVTIADPSLIPRTPTDKLNVNGARLRISRGITYGDGTTEVAPLGTFRVDQVLGDPDIGPGTISGSSLEAVIIDDVLKAPVTIGAGVTAVGGITQLIQGSIPGAVIISSAATNANVGTMTFDQQTSRWDACRTLATAIGCELYADAAGDFVIAPVPDLTGTSVVWEVAAGEGGAMISAQVGMSRAGVFNSITAYGENVVDGAAAVMATVEDTDPTSPTYVNGPFGRVPDFYSSATLTTTALCTAAATQLLKSSLKPNSSCDLTSLPNPLLEPGDVLRVVYADGTRELHQAASFEIELGPGGAFTMATIGAKADS